MKIATQTPTKALQSPAKQRATGSRSDQFVTLAETKALMAGSASARQQRLLAGDMITTDQAAEMNHTSRVTVNAWISKGRAIGLTQTKRGYRMPVWQFDVPIWSVLPALSSALGTHEGWALLAFLETPLGGLEGATPRQALERGEAERVLSLAASHT